ncbi:MAG: NUDIX hydrolase [Caldilineaceae bacterium]
MSASKSWYESLPQKRMGAGALFLNEAGLLLLVNPTYKPQWEIPGGLVEKNESPRAACIREVKEEIGLDKIPERLLCLNYLHPEGERTEGLMFVFWGGVLTAEEIASIRLPENELSEYRFVTIDEAAQLLTPNMTNRLRRSLDFLPTGQTLYLES